jgi:hypothetical protein
MTTVGVNVAAVVVIGSRLRGNDGQFVSFN